MGYIEQNYHKPEQHNAFNNPSEIILHNVQKKVILTKI